MVGQPFEWSVNGCPTIFGGPTKNVVGRHKSRLPVSFSCPRWFFIKKPILKPVLKPIKKCFKKKKVLNRVGPLFTVFQPVDPLISLQCFDPKKLLSLTVILPLVVIKWWQWHGRYSKLWQPSSTHRPTSPPHAAPSVRYGNIKPARM